MGRLDNNEFAKRCIREEEKEECTCDCMINLSGCPQETNNFIALACLVPFTFVIVIISISFLYYRVKIKGQSVFFPATTERGLIRPRPQDSFHIAVGVFNFSQMLVLILLIMDLFPNVMFAEMVIHFPKLLGFACAVLYPISIIYSTPILKQTTSYSLRVQWSPNKYFIDGLAIYLMLGPLFTIIPLTALTGYLADWHDYKRANQIFKIQAFVWSCWTIQYFITLLYVYYKLIFMLKGYIDILQRRKGENTDVDTKIKKLMGASFNLTWIVFAVFLMFSINSLEGILVGINFKGKSKEANKNFCEIYYFISWNFTIPVLSFIGQLIFLYDTLKNRKSIKNHCHSNTYDRKNNIQSQQRLLRRNNQETAESKSDQKSKSTSKSIGKSTTSKSTTSKSTTKINNSVSTMTTGTLSLIPWETNNINSDTNNWKYWDSSYFDYYFNEEDTLKNVPDDIIVSPDARRSWLAKKPIRTKDVTDRNLFLRD